MLLDCLLNRKSAMLGSGMRTLSAKEPTTAPNQMLHIPGGLKSQCRHWELRGLLILRLVGFREYAVARTVNNHGHRFT
jgi:hypothetical protein